MDMMLSMLMVEGVMGACAATGAFFYQRKMDREVAAGRSIPWAQYFGGQAAAQGHPRAANAGAASRPAGSQARPIPSAATLTPRDAYARLGVAPNVGPEELRRAYHRQCMRWHPDRFAMAPEPERATAARMMKQVNAAYALLAPRRA